MLDRIFIGLLVATGLASLLVFTVPDVVILGLFLFILPGLFLGLSPTIFVWLLTFYLSFRLLRLGARRLLSAIAAAMITILVMWQIPQAAIADAEQSFDAATMDKNIIPADRVTLSGDIKLSVPRLDDELLNAEEIERLREEHKAALNSEVETRPADCGQDCQNARRVPKYEDYVDKKRQVAWECDALCAALLATPGVKSVTIDAHADAQKRIPLTEKARTFRMLPKAQCPKETVTLKNPGSLNVQRSQTGTGKGLYPTMSLQAEWDIRLSSTHCVMSYPPVTAHDYTIEHYEDRWSKSSDDEYYSPSARIRKLLISDRKDQIILRKNLVSMYIPVAPLLLDTFQRTTEESPVQFATNVRSNGTPHEELNPADLLAKHSNLYVGGVDAGLVASLREQIVRLEANKSIPNTDPGFQLLEPWFTSFKADGAEVSKADVDLIIRLIGDERITEYRGLHNVLKKIGPDAIQFRDPIGRRMVSAKPGMKWTKYLASHYTQMPPGSMQATTANENVILNDPERRMYAGALILRQMDKGPASVPIFLEIIKTHAKKLKSPNRKRYFDDDHILPIDASRMALCHLGMQGKAALPEIRRMMAEGLVTAKQMGDGDWNFMLARIGMPIDEIRKPPTLSGTEKQYRARIAANVKNFKPDQDCRAYWGY